MPIGLQMLIALIGAGIGFVGRYFSPGSPVFEGLFFVGALIFALAFIRFVIALIVAAVSR